MDVSMMFLLPILFAAIYQHLTLSLGSEIEGISCVGDSTFLIPTGVLMQLNCKGNTIASVASCFGLVSLGYSPHRVGFVTLKSSRILAIHFGTG